MDIDKEKLREKLENFKIDSAKIEDGGIVVKMTLNFCGNYQSDSKISYYKSRWFYGLPYEDKAVKYIFLQPFIYNRSGDRKLYLPDEILKLVRPKFHLSNSLLDDITKKSISTSLLQIYKGLEKMSYKIDYSNFTSSVKDYKIWTAEIKKKEFEDSKPGAYFVVQDNLKIEKYFETIGEYDEFAILTPQYCGQVVSEVNDAVNLIKILNESFTFSNQDSDAIEPARIMIPILISVLSNISSVIHSKIVTSSLSLLEKLEATFIAEKSVIVWCSVEVIKKFIQRFSVDSDSNHIEKEYDEVEDKFNLSLKCLIERSTHIQDLRPGRRTLIIDGTKIDVNTGLRERKSILDDSDNTKKTFERASNFKSRFGYNVLTVNLLTQKSLIPIYFTIDGMGRHDKTLLDKIIRSKKVFKDGDRVILDRGFADFDLFSILKEVLHVDILIPAKKNLVCIKEILTLMEEFEDDQFDVFEEELIHSFETEVITSSKKKLKFRGVAVASNLKGSFVKDKSPNSESQSDLIIKGKKRKFMIFLYTGSDLEGGQILIEYRLRWGVEVGYGDMTSNMGLKEINGWKLYSIEFHIASVLLAKALVEIYKNTPKGIELLNTTIKALSNKFEKENIPTVDNFRLMVIKDNCYKLFSFEAMIRAFVNLPKQYLEKVLNEIGNRSEVGKILESKI